MYELRKNLMRLMVYILICLFGMSCQYKEPDAYIFSYFVNNGEDGLHLAYSRDGLKWTALNDNGTFLRPVVGDSKLMRDPCIVEGGDGRYHMVWTAGWNEKGIGYASSDDLINWSEQKFIPVMMHEPEARNCWAPEIFYDDQSDFYIIYWATTIQDRFSETDSTGDNGYNHRMYYRLTKDFKDFSDTQLLYDQGFNVIDATIQKTENEYIMFLKNETKYPEPEKNIRIARSTELTGNYSQASAPITDDWVEGPTVLKRGGDWLVYFDRYTNHQMGAVLSSDLVHWTDISDEIDFPEGTRHGTVLKVKNSVLKGLIDTE